VANPYAVVLDASVLAKDLHRHILLNLARAQCFRPIWSDSILGETEHTITKNGRDGGRVRVQLAESFESALAASSYIHLVRNVHISDENDRHVVAVALEEGADAICTDNTRDFDLSPDDPRLRKLDILTSDEFITDTIDLSPVKSIVALAAMRQAMTSVSNGSEFVELLHKRELVEAAEYLRKYQDRL
jgi:predicted nucleic acid-binding protein